MIIQDEKVTRQTARLVKEHVVSAVQSGDCVLDFSKVKQCDSSAVALVLSWIRGLRKKDLTPQLIGVSTKMKDLMQLYDVYPLVEKYICEK